MTDSSTSATEPAGRPAAPPSQLATMHPAYFAMVMATGIVSIASHLLGHRLIAVGLFYLNIPIYAALWLLTLMRLVRHRAQVVADATSHGRSVGFFTTVAATCVLGSQFLLIANQWNVAAGLWAFGILLWMCITYGVFTILTVKKVKPSLAEGINGGWLVAVVAAQSVATLGAQLAAGLDASRPQILLFCLCMWLGAGMLYMWIISLIFYRYTFFTLSPSDLAPPYWVNMGAVAISTLAGTMLVAAAPLSPVLMSLLPFVKGVTLLFWATATWWIPMLLILGVWRHVYERFPLKYDPLYWGAVFPLGMYTAATARVSRMIEAEYLMALPRGFLVVAIAAWAVTMLGLARHLVRSQMRTAS